MVRLKPEFVNCQKIVIDGFEYFQCIFRAEFKTQRERWWFLGNIRMFYDGKLLIFVLNIVVADCESKTGLDLMYNVTLLNNKTEWLKHFRYIFLNDFRTIFLIDLILSFFNYSADEYAVYPINLITLIIYCFILIAIIIESVKLIERKFFHLTFRIFILSIIFEFLGLIFVFQYNYNYSYYGYANHKYKTLGNFNRWSLKNFKINFTAYLKKKLGKGFTVLSNLMFMLLLILIAKGYSVTRARLKSRTSVKIAIFMTLYALCFFFLYFYEACCFDQAEVLYVYESWVGYCMIVLRFIGLSWFTISLFKTLKLYPSKKPFFYIVYIMYFVW